MKLTRTVGAAAGVVGVAAAAALLLSNLDVDASASPAPSMKPNWPCASC